MFKVRRPGVNSASSYITMFVNEIRLVVVRVSRLTKRVADPAQIKRLPPEMDL